MLTVLVSSDSPLRSVPTMQVIEKIFKRDSPSPAAIKSQEIREAMGKI